MKRWTVPVTLFLTLSLQARADDASKRAKVEELFTVMRINQMSQQIVASVQKQMNNMMRGMPGSDQLTPEQKRLMGDFQTKVMTLVNQSMGWSQFEPQMVNLYSTTYSEPEIDGILAFYKSPVGQTMLAKAPELTEKSIQISQSKFVTLQPKIQEMSQEFAKEFAAAAAPPTAHSGTSGASGSTGTAGVSGGGKSTPAPH